jgi:hypothetical protein
MALTITLTPEAEERLRDESARTGLPPETLAANKLEAFLLPVGGAPPPPVAASPDESELLAKINEGFPPEFWRRYRELIARREEGSLTANERTELVALTDRVEEKNWRRTEYLLALAALRKVALPDLVQQLGLRPEPVNPPLDAS